MRAIQSQVSGAPCQRPLRTRRHNAAMTNTAASSGKSQRGSIGCQSAVIQRRWRQAGAATGNSGACGRSTACSSAACARNRCVPWASRCAAVAASRGRSASSRPPAAAPASSKPARCCCHQACTRAASGQGSESSSSRSMGGVLSSPASTLARGSNDSRPLADRSTPVAETQPSADNNPRQRGVVAAESNGSSSACQAICSWRSSASAAGVKTAPTSSAPSAAACSSRAATPARPAMARPSRCAAMRWS